MNSKLALGTVQFGLDYGINNITGQIPPKEIKEILEFAKNNGIEFLDTAYLYGNSEKILGEVLRETGDDFNIISKLPKCSRSELRKYFNESLDRLHRAEIYGYMYHDFNTYLNDKSTLDELLNFKEEGKIKKFGFSLYYPDELEILFHDNLQFDMIQVPYNLLDRRFEQYFKELNDRGIIIHTRSVFLQGLFFKDYNLLSGKLVEFRNFLININEFAQNHAIPLENIALGIALNNKLINKIVVGVDNSFQLSELIAIEKKVPGKELYQEINEIISKESISEELFIPSNWN